MEDGGFDVVIQVHFYLLINQLWGYVICMMALKKNLNVPHTRSNEEGHFIIL